HWCLSLSSVLFVCFFKNKTAYESQVCLEFRRVLFRSHTHTHIHTHTHTHTRTRTLTNIHTPHSQTHTPHTCITSIHIHHTNTHTPLLYGGDGGLLEPLPLCGGQDPPELPSE